MKDTAAQDSTAQDSTAEDETVSDATVRDDADVKPGSDVAAERSPAPDATALVQPPPSPPTLVALFAAPAGGGAGVATPHGTGTVRADGSGLAAGTAPVSGTAAAGPSGVATAAGPATPGSATATVAPQPAAEPGNRTDGPAITEIGGTGSRGESADAAVEPGSPKPDFLAALADASRAAPDPGPAAAPAVAAPAAAHAVSSAAPAASAPAAAPAAPPIPLGQVPMTIGLRSLQGSSAFQIRLDPVELGRIEVKLEIDKARGTVTTHLVVDRADALQMLQRDAGQLQQALSQAGLDASTGVGLSLRGDGNAQDGSRHGGGSRQGDTWRTEASDTVPEAAPLRVLRGVGGLDIRI